jgi:hypothetical protein
MTTFEILVLFGIGVMILNMYNTEPRGRFATATLPFEIACTRLFGCYLIIRAIVEAL